MIKFAKLRKRYLVTGKCFAVVNVFILISALSYMLNVVCVNSMTVSYTNNGLRRSEAKEEDVSFTEEWELGVASIKPHMAHLLYNVPNLTDCLRKSMIDFLARRAAIYLQANPQPQQSKSVVPYV